ncbi:MAG: TolC family protein [Bacteroidia bacterium]|nr:TolC family protein [Bacteroidia bacterium]
MYSCILRLLLVAGSVCQGLGGELSAQIPLEAAPPLLSLAARLPSLDSLISLALVNSLALEYQHYATDREKELLRLAQKHWGNRLYIDGGYGYSNSFSNVTMDNAEETAQNAVLKVGDNYRIGINLRLSLYDLFARKNTVTAAQDKYRMAQTELKNAGR